MKIKKMISLHEVFPHSYVPFKFNLNHPPSPSRFIVAGLYPPANSHENEQHNNITSVSMISTLGHDDFDWIDLFEYMPLTKNKHVKLTKMHQYAKTHPELGKLWIHNILDRVVNQSIVYIAGKTCQMAWNAIQKNSDLLGEIECVDTNDMCTLCKHTMPDNRTWYSLHDRNHPSAQKMSRGDPKLTNHFLETMTLLNLIRNKIQSSVTKESWETFLKNGVNMFTIQRAHGLAKLKTLFDKNANIEWRRIMLLPLHKEQTHTNFKVLIFW